MHGINRSVVEAVCHWLGEGESGWLATVIRTYGSSPRPVGSLMAYFPQCGIVGSLSGGCVEEDLLVRLNNHADVHGESGVGLYRYGHLEGDQDRFSLPCGGQLHVVVERLQPEHSSHFQTLLTSLECRQRTARRVCLRSGSMSLENVAHDTPTLMSDEIYLTHRLSPHYQLLIVGAGEVSRYVARLASGMEFQVSLVDPRQNYLDLYPCEEVKTWCRLPDDLIREQFNDPYTAIIALSHDPRVDDMALLEALLTDAFFIGAMGSVRTSAARRERLRSLGLDNEALCRLRAPVGLDIGSKTPAEIALSAMAEIVAVKNRLERARSTSTSDVFDLQQESAIERVAAVAR